MTTAARSPKAQTAFTFSFNRYRSANVPLLVLGAMMSLAPISASAADNQVSQNAPAQPSASPAASASPQSGATTPASASPQAGAVPPTTASPQPEDAIKPDLLDGSLSAKGELEADEAEAASAPKNSLTAYQAAKKRFEERTGITVGGSLGILWQNYSTVILGQGDSVGGKFALNANVPLLNRGKPNNLTFDLAVESRGALASDFAPLQAGIVAGSGVPTAATWGQFNLGITQAYVRQSLAENRFQYTVGKIFAPNFVDAYPFFDDNRQFLNLAFSTNPTIASPLRGFGFVAAGFPGKGNLYLTGGMFTANSSDTGATVGDFFSRNEHFYFGEVGETSFARRGVPINARGPLDSNNLHVTLWYRDPLAPRGPEDGFLRPSPDAYGAAFNANYTIGEDFMWFTRAGIGKGSNFGTGAAAVGAGWRPHNARGNLAGAAAGWTNPGPPLTIPIPIDLRSQFTGELFYRVALSPDLAITPDYQLLYHPSLDPRRTTLSVFSIRGRITF